MFNLKNSAKSLILLPIISATLLAGVANAETLKTKNFSVKITRNCPGESVFCDNITYVGKDLRTGKSIRLKGKTIYGLGADRVTPSRFLGYEFRNNQYVYRVENNKLQVYKGYKLILEEQGTVKY
jgi:hypothetical protein